jgi:hypothetical protein
VVRVRVVCGSDGVSQWFGPYCIAGGGIGSRVVLCVTSGGLAAALVAAALVALALVAAALAAALVAAALVAADLAAGLVAGSAAALAAAGLVAGAAWSSSLELSMH